MWRRDEHDHPRIQLVRVALHSLEHAQVRSVSAVAGARFALRILAAEHGALTSRVLVHDLVDELADADVAELLDVEGPFLARLQAGRAEFFDEPGEQRLLGPLRCRQSRHLAENLLPEPGLDGRALWRLEQPLQGSRGASAGFTDIERRGSGPFFDPAMGQGPAPAVDVAVDVLRQAAFGDETVDVRAAIATGRADVRLGRAVEVKLDSQLAAQELGASIIRQGVGVDGGPQLGPHLARHGHAAGPGVCSDACAFGHAGSRLKPLTDVQE